MQSPLPNNMLNYSCILSMIQVRPATGLTSIIHECIKPETGVFTVNMTWNNVNIATYYNYFPYSTEYNANIYYI